MLTSEQLAVVNAAQTGEHLKVAAFAGAGKTFTLQAVARALQGRRILYLTFSRALANEAQEKFRGLAEAMTNHALAFHKTGKPFAEKGRLKSSLFQARRLLAEAMPELDALREWGFRDREEAMFPVLETVNRFTQSESDGVGVEHIPDVLRLEIEATGSSFEDFAACLVSLARQAWEFLSAPEAPYPVSHDVYLKLYQLSRPQLPYDVILFDEAQDANPAMLGILLPQQAQRIFVGDPHQQIYAWRGAVNAMDRLEGTELALSQSFRFSEAIADEATELLQLFKGESRRVRGNPNPKRDGSIAILSRTNAGALREVLRLLEGSHKVALVNKVEELTDALEAAYRLYKGHKPRHPEFSLFRSWEHLKFLIERFPSIAAQYRPYERLVEEYTDRIPDICRTLRHSLVREEEAEVVVSTAHRSKGREWDGVVLAEDFEGVTLAQENAAHGCVALYPEEANLTYVAFTRARNALNKGSFSAVLEYQKHLATAVRNGAMRLCTEENLKPKAPEPQPLKAEEAPQRGVRTLWKKLFGD
ncbi:UvrD-helicase domain-containing protein [Meiothermus ruber]|uniref:UvrD-helicase domain-containing protein n=1 Tax=Meiothermus ruber TaxID=277 RepID=UPI0003455DC6|nr:UvrD-helicase domain-containing protein [Meiothermus ruber]GAO74283.1 UvrD/REP helicase [Meiothermus ruber H328]